MLRLRADRRKRPRDRPRKTPESAPAPGTKFSAAWFFLHLEGRLYRHFGRLPVRSLDRTMVRKDRRAPLEKRFYWTATAAALFCCTNPVFGQNKSDDYGERIFMQNRCFTCHGQQGVGGIGTAFRDDPFLKFDDYVAGQIMLGRGVMPPFGDKLDDKEIAAVASYIRNSWGNRFGVIKPEQVTQVRHELGALRQRGSPPQNTGGEQQ
jgi:mono/diheme cytochrome c family protein